MPTTRYDITHAGDRDEVVIISVHGYIDATTSPEFSKIIDQQLAQEKYRLIINLQDVDYISSIGWGVFISNLKEMREHRGDLVLTNMCTNVHNIFDLMELSSIIKSFDEVNKAVFYFLGTKQIVEFKQQVAAASAGPVESMPPKQETPVYTPSEPIYKPVNRPAPIELVSERSVSSYKDEVLYTSEHILEKHIVKVILERPYYSIRQITKALRLPRYGSVKKSKRKIKRELVKLGLENREDRYEFALRNRSR